MHVCACVWVRVCDREWMGGCQYIISCIHQITVCARAKVAYIMVLWVILGDSKGCWGTVANLWCSSVINQVFHSIPHLVYINRIVECMCNTIRKQLRYKHFDNTSFSTYQFPGFYTESNETCSRKSLLWYKNLTFKSSFNIYWKVGSVSRRLQVNKGITPLLTHVCLINRCCSIF